MYSSSLKATCTDYVATTKIGHVIPIYSPVTLYNLCEITSIHFPWHCNFQLYYAREYSIIPELLSLKLQPIILEIMHASILDSSSA